MREYPDVLLVTGTNSYDVAMLCKLRFTLTAVWNWTCPDMASHCKLCLCHEDICCTSELCCSWWHCENPLK